MRLQASMDNLTRQAEATRKDVGQLAASRDFPPIFGAQGGTGVGRGGASRSLFHFQKQAPGVFSAPNTESDDTTAASDDDMETVMSKKKTRLEKRKRVSTPTAPPISSAYAAAAATGLHLISKTSAAPVSRAAKP